MSFADNHTRCKTVGATGEMWTFNTLMELGFDVSMNPDPRAPNCDLRVESMPIEVKTSYSYPQKRGHLMRRQRWQWHISKTAERMTGYWVAILLAIQQSTLNHGYHGIRPGDIVTPYIVPGRVINARSSVNISVTSPPDVYSGWLDTYRQNWNIIECQLDARDLLTYQRLTAAERRAHIEQAQVVAVEVPQC